MRSIQAENKVLGVIACKWCRRRRKVNLLVRQNLVEDKGASGFQNDSVAVAEACAGVLGRLMAG